MLFLLIEIFGNSYSLHYVLFLFLLETNSKIKQDPNIVTHTKLKIKTSLKNTT